MSYHPLLATDLSIAPTLATESGLLIVRSLTHRPWLWLLFMLRDVG